MFNRLHLKKRQDSLEELKLGTFSTTTAEENCVLEQMHLYPACSDKPNLLYISVFVHSNNKTHHIIST